MAVMDSMDLQIIKDRIELMPKHYQLGVGRILLKDYNVSHNENQNGIFINWKKQQLFKKHFHPEFITLDFYLAVVVVLQLLFSYSEHFSKYK